MLLIAITIVILLLTVVTVLFFKRYTIVRINGESMFPTLVDGQLRLLDRKHFHDNYDILRDNEDYYKGRVFCYESPNGTIVIKRLTYISFSIDWGFWFEGDNELDSLDSRMYGYVSGKFIYGDIVDFKTSLKRLFKFS